jgi:hypothetical protein
MNSAIAQAIEQHRIVDLRYHGYSRSVEPHAYGRDKKGDEVLRCFQVSGGSDSGERSGWKLLKVGEAFTVELTNEKFTPRAEYKRNDKAMEFFFCQL